MSQITTTAERGYTAVRRDGEVIGQIRGLEIVVGKPMYHCKVFVLNKWVRLGGCETKFEWAVERIVAYKNRFD